MPTSDPAPSNVRSNLLIAAGVLVFAVALGADVMGIGGSPRFAGTELAITAVSLALLLSGIASSVTRRAWLRRVWGSLPTAGPALCLVVPVWFGLITGLVEVAHQSVRQYGFGQFTGYIERFSWLIPVFYVVLFVAIGLVFALPVRWMRRIATLPLLVFVFALLGLWSQLLIYPNIDNSASLVLSGGVAFQLARMSARRARGMIRLQLWTLPIMVVLVAAGAIGVGASERMRETSEKAALTAAPADAPNVLVIVLDTVRADDMSCYGYHRATSPSMDRLGESGVVFNWAIATSPWTLPSHATMFTGRYTHELSTGWLSALDDKFPTLAEVFTARGYTTAGFVGNVAVCSRGHGLERGFIHYEDYYASAGTAVLAASFGRHVTGGQLRLDIARNQRNSAETVTTQFLGWLSEQESDRPFFGFLNYYDAHALYLPPPPYDEMWGNERSEFLCQWDSHVQHWTDEQMEGFVDAYDGCIRLVDKHIERIVDDLEKSGRLDDTLLIIVGDHGEQFGEHGLISHANSLYRPLLHIPLIFHFPRSVPAKRVSDFVSMRDICATILDLAGIEDARFPGHSLSQFWAEERPVGERLVRSPLLAEVAGGIRRPEWEPVSKGEMKSITIDGMHLILNGDKTLELYNFLDDPNEQNNLIDSPRGERMARQMLAALNKVVSGTN